MLSQLDTALDQFLSTTILQQPGLLNFKQPCSTNTGSQHRTKTHQYSFWDGSRILCTSHLLEIGMWWLDINTWKQSQPQSKQQEAKGQFAIGKPQTANRKLQTANRNLLPPFAPSQKSIYSRPFWSDFSFPSHVLLYFDASNIDSSSQQDKISTSNTPLLLPRYIK